MATRGGPETASPLARPVRCRCGHLPTHHMVVAGVPGGASYRLDPAGPCAICGEATCRKYAPGAP